MIASGFRTLAVGLVALATTPVMAATGADPTGVWLDAAGRGAVEIAPCGDGDALCGRVVWVKAAEHQSRCGVQILGNLDKGRNGTWGGGWIYSPDHDRKFDVEVKPLGPDKLRVVGWAGLRMFSETHVWKRASADIARCGGGETIAAAPAKGGTVAMAQPSASDPAAVSEPVPAPKAVPRQAPASAAEATVDKPVSAVEQAEKSAVTHPRVRSEVKSSGDKRAVRSATVKKPWRVVETRYFKRTADGTCKVDTPWIKLDFGCRRL